MHPHPHRLLNSYFSIFVQFFPKWPLIFCHHTIHQVIFLGKSRYPPEYCVIDDNLASQKHNGLHCCNLQLQGPRSRVFYYSRNNLLHTWNSYYTEPPIKVPITPHRLESRCYAPSPIVIALGSFSGLQVPSFKGGPELLENKINEIFKFPAQNGGH